MAIAYFDVSTIGRSTGANAVASAAYRHAAKMTNEITGETRSYEGKAEELVHEEIILPEGAPDWAAQRYGGEGVAEGSERLWNDVELRENQHSRRAQAQLAQSYTVALPSELSLEQNVALVRGYIRDNLIVDGAVADLVIHDKGDGNPHAHIMTTMRTLGESGLDLKIRSFMNRRQDITDKRFGWACAANYALEKAGFEARIDHRRLEEQGIELGPLTYNHEIASHVEAGGQAYRLKMRVEEARAANEVYLMERPEHMLTVVAAGNPLFTEEDVVDGFKRYLPTGGGAKGVNDLAARAMASADLVATGREDTRGNPLFTTRALVEMSRQMEADAARLAGSWLGISDAGPVELNPALSDQQCAAVEAMVAPERLTLVTGYAGSGKTFALKEAARVWSARGVEVLGGAVAGKAVQELAGIEGTTATLAQWEARWNKGIMPTHGNFVFIMDEAGMVGTAIWSRIQARIEQMGGKLIAVGDGAQLAPILDTSAFLHLSKIARHVVIDEVRRQVDPRDREASRQLSQGGAEAARALEYYRDKGAIQFSETVQVAIDDLARAHFEHEGAEHIALAHRNADVAALNLALRKEAVRRGMLEMKSQIALHGGDLKLAIGDRVRFTQAYRIGGITKSSFATVLDASEHSLVLSVDGVSGVQTIDTRVFDGFDYGYAATVHKSQGMSVDGHVSLLVTRGIDRHLATVGLTRHQRSVTAFVARDEIENFGALCKAVERSGLLEVVQGGDLAGTARMGVGVEQSVLATRADWRGGDAPPDGPFVQSGFEGDAALSNEAMRMGGLLRSEFKVGDAPVGDDPRGYALDPLKVVDDLLAERGVLRPSEVAERLAEAVKGPDLFARLYVQAMSHPDLVILSEDGQRGEGRVYSSIERMEHVLGLMDRGVAMACRAPGGPLLDAPALFDLPQLPGAQRSALAQMVWPSRLGIVEEIGTGGLARLAGAAQAAFEQQSGAGDPRPARVIALGAHGARTERFAEAAGIKGYDLYGLRRALEQGHVTLTGADMIVVPDASGLHQNEVSAVMDLVEPYGAKLVLHRDPSLDGPGSVVRHLAARVPTVRLDGLDAISAGWRAVMGAADRGGEDFARALRGRWNAGFVSGAAGHEMQVEAFAAQFIADASEEKLGLARSAAQSITLNQAIEAALSDARVGAARSLERQGLEALDLHVGSRVVMARWREPFADVHGARGTVVGFGPSGSVEVQFGERVVQLLGAEEMAALEHGYVLPLRAARGLDVGVVHGFVGRSADRRDLTAMLQLGREVHLCLPVDLEAQGEAARFMGMALAQEGKGSALDYGFDASRALRAAGDWVQSGAAFEAPALAVTSSARAQAIEAQTLAHLRQHPEFIVADMMRDGARFDRAALKARIETIFVPHEGRNFDSARMVEQVLGEGLESGALLKAELRPLDGTQLYVSRVQAEIELGALERGAALGRAKLDEFLLTYDDMVAVAQSRALGGVDNRRLALVAHGGGAVREQLLKTMGDTWRARGYQIVAAHVSKGGAEQVAQLLGGAEQSGSLASIEAQWAMGRVPKQDMFVVFLDGASGVDARQWARVQERVGAMGGKLVALSSRDEIERGNSASMFRLLSRELGVDGLDLAIVQHNAYHREATEALRRGAGYASGALDIYDRAGAVHFAARKEGAVGAIVRAYWSSNHAHGPDAEWRQALTHSKADAAELASALRREGVQLGRLGPVHEVFGREIAVGEVLVAQRGVSQMSVPQGGRVQYLGLDETGAHQVRALGQSGATPVQLSAEHLEHCFSTLAANIHAMGSQVVDRSYVLATAGMDLPLYKAALTRHLREVQIHVPETQIRDMDALKRNSERVRDVEVLRALPEREALDAPALPQALAIDARADRTGGALQRGAGFGHDAHLQQVASRMAGLLEISYERGDPVVGDDPRGYALDPRKVVDDLLGERSVLRADDVASALSRVVRDPRSFTRLFADAMSHPDLVILSENGQRGEGRVYSTLGHIQREVEIGDQITRLALAPSRFEPSAQQLTRLSATEYGPMSPDQVAALHHATSASRVAMIAGYAGSGKSTVLGSVRQIYQEKGWEVIGAALAGDAARALEDSSGIKSRSLAKLLRDAEARRISIGPRTVLVIDEAAMLNSDQMAGLLDLTERTGASLRLVGDPQQIQPRGPGAMWRAAQERIGSAVLDTIWRQKDMQDRRASQQLAVGGEVAQSALAYYASKGAVVSFEGDAPKGDAAIEAMMSRMAAAYAADPSSDKIMLAHRRDHVARLNDLARAQEQRLRGEDLPQLAVHGRGEDTLTVQAGDRIVFTQNETASGIVNGDRAEVVGVDPKTLTYTAKIGSGEEARFVRFAATGGPSFDYGYASTIHKSQGKTVDSTHALVTSGYSHSLLYVAATRHRDSLKLYAPQSGAEALGYLQKIAARDQRNVSVLERGYGFEASRAFEAAVQLPEPGQEDVADYVARHTGTRRTAQSLLPTSIARLLGGDKPQVLPLGTDARALSDVIGAGQIKGQRDLAPDVQLSAMRQLQEVSDPEAWSRARRGLCAPVLREIEAIARQRGNAPEGQEELPAARAFARAIALSEARGDAKAAQALSAGLDLLGARVQAAQAEGVYDALLKEARRPALPSKELTAQPEPIAPAPRKQPNVPARTIRAHPAYGHAVGASTLGLLSAPSEAAIAKRVLRSMIGTSGPGFFETLGRELNQAPLEELDMTHSQELAIKLTPITSEQKALMAQLFGCTGSFERSGKRAALIAGIGNGGTLAVHEFEEAFSSFTTLAREAGSIGSTEPHVPKEWKERLSNLTLNGHMMAEPKVESAQEWDWAMKHAFRAGSLNHSAQELKQAKTLGDWASTRFMKAITPKQHHENFEISYSELDMVTRSTRFVAQEANVHILEQPSAAEAFAALPIEKIQKIVEAEPVAQDWKDRFIQRFKMRDTPKAHAKFENQDEFGWAMKTVYTQGAALRTGTMPQKNDLAKKLAEEIRQDQSRTKGMRMF